MVMGMRRKTALRSVNTARLVYLLICEMAGAAIANHAGGPDKIWLGIVIGLVVAAFFILVESLMKQFTLRGFSNATVGLLIGVFCAWLLSRGVISLIEATLSNQLGQLDARGMTRLPSIKPALRTPCKRLSVITLASISNGGPGVDSL